MDYFIAILPLLLGWGLDMFEGDPACLPHPVVGFGKLISICEHRLNRGNHRLAKGAITALLLIGSVFVIALVALNLLGQYIWIKVVVESVLIYYCLAGTT